MDHHWHHWIAIVTNDAIVAIANNVAPSCYWQSWPWHCDVMAPLLPFKWDKWWPITPMTIAIGANGDEVNCLLPWTQLPLATMDCHLFYFCRQWRDAQLVRTLLSKNFWTFSQWNIFSFKFLTMFLKKLHNDSNYSYEIDMDFILKSMKTEKFDGRRKRFCRKNKFGIYQGFYSSAEGYSYKTQARLFSRDSPYFTPQSRFPDHSAESTGRDCIESSELRP